MSLPVFLSICLVTNAWAFAAFCVDKVKAVRNQRRISEASLMTLSLLGGVGALSASSLIRHKTSKQPFRRNLEIITAVHVFTVAFIATLLF